MKDVGTYFLFIHSQVNMRILTVGGMIFCCLPASELGTMCLVKAAHGTCTVHRVELIQIPGVSISVQKPIFKSFEASALFQAQQTESWSVVSELFMFQLQEKMLIFLLLVI